MGTPRADEKMIRTSCQILLSLCLLPAWLLLAPLSAAAELVTAKVVGVLDGDTMEVFHNNHAERIRLHGIDCPEKGQAYGTKAKQATSELVFGKAVNLHTHGKDKYGRTIADVLLPDGTNVNQQLVKDGWCWWFQKHAPKDFALQQSEQEEIWVYRHRVPGSMAWAMSDFQYSA